MAPRATSRLLASMALTRYRFPGKSAITVSSLVPLVVPYIILGISLLQFIRHVLQNDATKNTPTTEIIIKSTKT